MRVLMAEDDPVSRLLLQSTLRKWGHEPVVACDGAEAMAILEGDAPPEIAILDWMMPGVDGLEICHRVRQRSPALPLYIILLTAKGRREDLVAGLAAGADDYVTKPFHSQELLARFQAGVRITDLQRSLASRARELEAVLVRLRQMQQGQKLEALGQMASGLAHEINTPTQYVGDNIRFFQEAWSQVAPLLQESGDNPDLAYLTREVPRALDDSLQGTQKIAKIIRAMRDFSHSRGSEKVSTDINQAIETTLEVSTSEWKYVADVETHLDLQLPRIPCFPGDLHQVLLNLVVNAAQAMADVKAATGEKGILRITTSWVESEIEIRISDTGAGIPEQQRERVFEPFFTTRDVGKGSGQGLAIAYSAIVQQHGGRIWFETETGKGTTFVIRLPKDEIGKETDERKSAHSFR